MCVASAITDHFRDKWPLQNLPLYPTPSTFPGGTPAPVIKPGSVIITIEQWDEYQKLKKIAMDYDKATGQPDCEKGDLATWEAAVVEVLRQQGTLPSAPEKTAEDEASTLRSNAERKVSSPRRPFPDSPL